MDYASVRAIHIVCAGISIAFFIARGSMQLADVDWRRWRWLRLAPHLNDTLLLGAAVALALASHQYPLAQPWLTAKVVALLAYIALGMVALRAGTAAVPRLLAFCLGLATAAYIVAVAITRSATLGLARGALS